MMKIAFSSKYQQSECSELPGCQREGKPLSHAQKEPSVIRQLDACWHQRKRCSEHLNLQVINSTSIKMQDTQDALHAALLVFLLLEIPISFGSSEQMCLRN